MISQGRLSSSLRRAPGVLQALRTQPPPQSHAMLRGYASEPAKELDLVVRRSYLYVPSSSDRMLQKSLTTKSDIIIYDLEDSVAPSEADKADARVRLAKFLTETPQATLPHPSRVAVRLNATDTPFFERDIDQAMRIPHIRTFILPKVHSQRDLQTVSYAIEASGRSDEPINLVASIESARALWGLGEIAGWKDVHRQSRLIALLFAAEDYCADTSIIRTSSRQELLYTRSKIAIAAKAFGLDAIDMVCVNYKDMNYLKEECEDGRRLGFTGKQAIHPTQVDLIQSTFVPTDKEILRAAKIVHQMAQAHASQRGAVGLDLGDGKGGKEMIDAPMLKQAENTVRIARAAGIEIPTFN
ncbi:citrate lyase beta subunit [Artomyces pyxidatus]|uniref:Citrate lyase beta subunit n=1 Tax=Artomyces pyxidatus TaxID=48021 RepID=A0ACB8SPG1_9AGAM|nr:citrate lyase beta subunit [Artomyces pyxidatus]